MSKREFPSFAESDGSARQKADRHTENDSLLSDRLRFIPYEGKQILLIDVSDCSASEVEKILRAVPDVVTTHEKRSLLILSDFTGASFDSEAMRVMKETAVFDKPYVKKSALTGKPKTPAKLAEGLVEDMSKFARREFPVFESREEALAWLVKD